MKKKRESDVKALKIVEQLLEADVTEQAFLDCVSELFAVILFSHIFSGTCALSFTPTFVFITLIVSLTLILNLQNRDVLLGKANGVRQALQGQLWALLGKNMSAKFP